jgi:hypothetical protein
MASRTPTGPTTYYIRDHGFYNTLDSAKRDAQKTADAHGWKVSITKYVETRLQNGQFRTTQKVIWVGPKSSPKMRKALAQLARRQNPKRPLRASIPVGKKIRVNWVKQNRDGTVTVSVPVAKRNPSVRKTIKRARKQLGFARPHNLGGLRYRTRARAKAKKAAKRR